MEEDQYMPLAAVPRLLRFPNKISLCAPGYAGRRRRISASGGGERAAEVCVKGPRVRLQVMSSTP